MNDSPYTHIKKLAIPGLFSYDVYRVKPDGVDPKHTHNFEIVYVIKGNCKTHKQGHIYIYRKNQPHELINDSKDELVLACFTIPSEGPVTYV